MNLAKKMLFAISLSVLILMSMVWVFTKTIPPLGIKAIINKELSALTSQNTRIDGDIMWQLFPKPRIKINQINIGTDNVHAVGNKIYSLSAENLLLSLKLSSLFKGEIVFNQVTIDRAKLNIYPAAISRKTKKIDSQPNFSRRSFTVKNLSARLAIENLSLTNSQVNIIRPQDKTTLSNIQLSAKQINLQKNFFPLKIKTTLNTILANNKIKAQINYNGSVRLDQSLSPSDLSALQKTSATGQLLINNLHINNFKASKITATLVSNKKTLQLRPLNLQLYNGKSIGDLHYNFSSENLTINQTASNLDGNQLFKSLFDKNIAQGKIDFSLHNTIDFNTSHWQEHLLGNGNLTMKDGSLGFIDLPKMIQNASKKIHALQKQNQVDSNATLPPPSLDSSRYQEGGKSKFQLLNLQYTLLNSQLMDNTFLLQTNDLLLKGKSQVNLKTETINGELSAQLITKDSVVNNIQRRLGGSFPLKLTGNMTQPIVAPNSQIITPLISRYLLMNSLKEPLKQIQHQVKDIIMSPKLLFLNK